MWTKTRIRIAVLFVLAAVLVYPSILMYRYINYSGGSFSSVGARTALVEAIKQNDLALMRALLILGADPDRRPGDAEMPPLSVAAQEGRDRAAAVLLNYGANPDSAENIFVDPFEIAKMPPGSVWTFDRPMFRAAKGGHRKVVDVLRANGARYEIWDAIFLGDTAFVQAALSNSPEMAELVKSQGRHALAIAVTSDNVRAAQTFLELGVDPFENRDSKVSPYDLALSGSNTEIVKLFEAHKNKLPA